MKAIELIRALVKVDPDTQVYLADLEGELHDEIDVHVSKSNWFLEEYVVLRIGINNDE